MKPGSRKVVVVSFDGLRPDLIDRVLTPNICRLQDVGATLARHRTGYPSETRVAFPSLVTGATASRHGMVGNKYVDRLATHHRYVDTADAVLLDRLNRESAGRLMTTPTLGEILATAGRSMAVLASNTAGTTRLFHHKAEDFGHIRLSGHFREACTPADVLAAAEAQFGRLPPVPPRGEPDFEAQDFLTSAFLGLIWPRFAPDLTILSFGEPDTSSHLNGTGAPKTREIIAFCDRQLGRLIDWWEGEGRDAGVQIMVMSDHGHITAHTRASVVGDLGRAGYSPGVAPGIGVDVVVVPGQVGSLYLTDPDPSQVTRLVESIVGLPWCGPVFTRPRNEVEGIARGSLGMHLVFADHDRAPDVYFAFRADDTVDPFGLIGGTFYDNDRRAGLGVHGGLHPKELATVGVVAGSSFRGAGFVSSTPSGICDLAPTILRILGIAPPAGMTGRVLAEIVDDESSADASPAVRSEQVTAGLGDYEQVLRRVAVGPTIYLDGGWAGVKATRDRGLSDAPGARGGGTAA